MTGGRCHRRRKMMARGPDGGCGTEEKPCPIYKSPTKFPARETTGVEKPAPASIDFYTQARKALCQRSPFDTEDALQVSTVLTLPSVLANLLSKHSDNRKRRKKSHLGAEAKKSRSGGVEKSSGPNIWTKTEEYFRELTVDDIDKLHELNYLSFLVSHKCFSIPIVGSVGNGDAVNEINGVCDSANGAVKEEEVKEFIEVDSVGANALVNEEKGCSSSSQMTMTCSGLEWLLGSRTKIYLTSERPSKKRKLLGGDAGLGKLLVASPVEGLSSLCHYCSLGETGDQLNCLIVCSSCNVAVHQRCYGVQEDVTGSWLCFWCKQGNAVESSDRPCLLCPKKGGALKPVSKGGVWSGNCGSMEFTHLFCCQWMPEVYVEDTRTMEPIMNIEGIKETRRKLICYLCKVKCGACVRCSNGTCRTSFHPICAREARHRMEIWGKFGCDDVELRAFCLKHSEVRNVGSTQQSGDTSVAIVSDSYVTKHQPVTLTVNKLHKLKISRKNGDKITVHIEKTDTNVDKLGNCVLHEEGLTDARSDSRLQSECGDAQQSTSVETFERSTNEDVNISESLDFTVLLKKLIDRGKVNVKDVASEIGISPELLTSLLAEDCLAPDLHCKLVTWLKSHAFIGSLQKNLKVKIKSSVASKDETGDVKDSNAGKLLVSDIPDVVPVKSVLPRRRTKNNIKILKGNKVICSSKETISGEEMSSVDGLVMDGANSGQLICENTSKGSVYDATTKNLMELDAVHDTLGSNSPKHEGGRPEGATISELLTPNSDPENPICSVVKTHTPHLIKADAVTRSYIHPLVRKTMMKMQNLVLLNDATFEFDGLRDRKISPLEASSSSDICCDKRVECSNSNGMITQFDGANLEQLVKARNMGVPEMCPEDEVEGKLIFYQHRLLSNVVARKRFSDDLIYKILKSLPSEIDAVGKQKWDAVLVNQYLSELREAKKQGRKERRHKEAQAVLAAATAAAAASSRISSFRKDALDESAHQGGNLLKVSTSSGRTGFYSQQAPRATDTLPKYAVYRGSTEMNSDFVGSISSDFCKENPRTCEICSRLETILNPILVCSSCKVAVHLDCYRSDKDATGPWYCELCKDLSSSRSSETSAVNSLVKPYFAAECALCGGSAGAFRKSTDGQWIHAFCAEWVLESTFRRGQVKPVEGMDSVLKGSDVCHICHCKKGVCIKCNYGHCQSTFHPYCARSSGFYINVKTGGGKLLHKAYCEKHSLEQRAKALTQKHGIEELKSLKQIRVELERLRLLCERIIKREKLKRELVFSSQDILISNKETVAMSARTRRPFYPPDLSSESATTSLKGNTDDCRSGSEAIQRSDDITVDSTVSGKRRIKFPVPMDNDQRTDDSSTSQHLFMQKPRERVAFSGKQIPQRPSFVASQNLSDDGEKRSSFRKHNETVEASMNRSSIDEESAIT